LWLGTFAWGWTHIPNKKKVDYGSDFVSRLKASSSLYRYVDFLIVPSWLRSALILFFFVFGKWVIVVHRGIRLVTYLLVERVLASGSRILRILGENLWWDGWLKYHCWRIFSKIILDTSVLKYNTFGNIRETRKGIAWLLK